MGYIWSVLKHNVFYEPDSVCCVKHVVVHKEKCLFLFLTDFIFFIPPTCISIFVWSCKTQSCKSCIYLFKVWFEHMLFHFLLLDHDATHDRWRYSQLHTAQLGWLQKLWCKCICQRTCCRHPKLSLELFELKTKQVTTKLPSWYNSAFVLKNNVSKHFYCLKCSKLAFCHFSSLPWHIWPACLAQ